MLNRSITSLAGLAIVEKAIKLFFLLFLSRLLAPAEIGVVAAASVVVYFADMFVNVGFAACLIQFEKISETTIRVAQTLTLIAVSIISGIFYVFLPSISTWIGIPELQSIGLFLIGILVLRAFSSIAEALLQREMKAIWLMKISIISYLVGILGVTIPLVYFGYGYEALIYGMTVETIIYAFVSYCLTRHSVLPLITKSESKSLMGKGFGFFLTRTIDYLALNIDYGIVSRYLGSHALGIYSRAYRIMEYPSYIYRVAVDRVLFPAMAKEQQNKEFLEKTLLQGVFFTIVLSAPLSGYIAANGENIIGILLGETWAEAAIVLSILTMFGSYRMAYMILNTYVRSIGKVSISSQHALLFLSLITVLCYYGSKHGLNGVAFAAGSALFIHSCIYAVRVAMLMRISWYRILNLFLLAIPITLYFYLPNYYLLKFLELNYLVGILVTSVISILLAVILSSGWLLVTSKQKESQFRDSMYVVLGYFRRV